MTMTMSDPLGTRAEADEAGAGRVSLAAGHVVDSAALLFSLAAAGLWMLGAVPNLEHHSSAIIGAMELFPCIL